MPITPEQAGDNLKEIERAGRRSTEAYLYAASSPSCILWGVIWIVGYAGTYIFWRFDIQLSNWLWGGLLLLGVVGGAAIGARQGRGKDNVRRAATFVVIFSYTFASFAVFRPTNSAAAAAFVPLIVASTYAIFGIWKGLRFLYAGIALAALTLGGFFWFREYFMLWMAAIGGGSLILIGLWLRKV